MRSYSRRLRYRHAWRWAFNASLPKALSASANEQLAATINRRLASNVRRNTKPYAVNETPINPDEILVLDPFPRDMFRKAGVFMHRLIAPCDSPRAVAWKCE